MHWWTPKSGASASAKGRHVRGSGKKTFINWGKWGYCSGSWFPKNELSPQEGLEITLRRQVQEKLWEVVALPRGQRGHPVSHRLLHYVCRGVLPKPPAAVISTRLRTEQAEKKEGPRGPGCSVCHRVSREGGGVSNPPGPGQLPGSSSLPSMAAPQPLSRHLMTPFAGQGLPAAYLLRACAPNSCRHRNATFNVHLLLRGPGFFWDLHRHLAGSRGKVVSPNLPL